jgi:proline iminopeptidase
MMMTLFPELESYEHFYLKVDEIHELYVEACGNPQGIPVVYLHGGPGAGCQPKHRRFFDSKAYHIILFDQRGAGRSKPFAEMRNNTIKDLISDIEIIRERFGIKKWLVYGGSWGSTLALAYGEAHPQACLGFILRGIFLMREEEIKWFLEDVKFFYPEAWEQLSKACDATDYKTMLRHMDAIYKKAPLAAQKDFAFLYAAFESSLSTLLPEPMAVYNHENSLGLAKLEFHYFYHQRKDFHLLKNVNKIKHLPCTIVQGRYDMVCPPISAYELHKAWPGSELIMVPNAGHSASEPPIIDALVSATEQFSHKLLRS